MQQNTNTHIPVLLEQTLEYLAPKTGQTYLDLTAGYGGHSSKVIDIVGQANAHLVDQDVNAIKSLRNKFPNTTITQSDFAEFLLTSETKYDLILADIGISSPHVDIAARGFSFRLDGPLDMRMNQSQALDADTVINTYSEKQLSEIFWKYGEERQSRRLARLIYENKPFTTTTELAQFIVKHSKYGKKHPATKIFQALRIEVNQELSQLQTLLDVAPSLLNPKGKLAVISFHSLEDRMIKRKFADIGQDTLDSEYLVITKRPVVPSPTEIVINPRARSAKLRVLQRK